jgi:hypothetical protein
VLDHKLQISDFKKPVGNCLACPGLLSFAPMKLPVNASVSIRDAVERVPPGASGGASEWHRKKVEKFVCISQPAPLVMDRAKKCSTNCGLAGKSVPHDQVMESCADE